MSPGIRDGSISYVSFETVERECLYFLFIFHTLRYQLSKYSKGIYYIIILHSISITSLIFVTGIVRTAVPIVVRLSVVAKNHTSLSIFFPPLRS